jgi:hypothetical protein
MNYTRNILLALAGSSALAAAGFVSCADAGAPRRLELGLTPANPLPGAIFTTLADGSAVNANIYAAKEDVYLDGGPGPHAPAAAAGLPAGDYFYQVTDPSGKDLLSSDHVSCRKVRVNANGVIELVYPGTNYVWQAGGWQPTACQHGSGTDSDHAELGAITVQLFPYDDTPNSGGVYKAWMTPVADYAGNANFVPSKRNDKLNGELWQPSNAHGFVPSSSKTDNFKLRKGRPCAAQLLSLSKFHDANVNGVQDSGEPSIEGWRMGVSDPLGGSNNYYTTTSLSASAGRWTVVEDQPAGTRETSSFLDATRISLYPVADPIVVVEFGNGCGESHTVTYGNVGLGQVEACKVYDRNADGQVDEDEPNVSGWIVTLTGTDVSGAQVGPLVQQTDQSGCTTFSALLPGQYQVSEQLPGGGWQATGEASQAFAIESSLAGSELSANSVEAAFTNVCLGAADFGTKGYWHNKNGLAELTDADIAYANGLPPYATPSSYFAHGDEPFDGRYEGGTPVAGSLGESGELIAAAGSARAEVSQFLVDANATGDPREQLAQQLLAFIFNARHRLDDANAAIELPDGSFASASSLIEEAVIVWGSGSAQERTTMAQTLDQLNNGDAVPFVHWNPCAVSYP